MSTGPQGQQGLQGPYGPRGVTGAFGWGYGTTTGPTGPVGPIHLGGASDNTVIMTTANASQLFRIRISATVSGISNSTALVLPTGLSSSNIGQFWSFSNDLSPSGGAVPSLNLVQQGTYTSIVTIKPYALATLVYNGGTSGYGGDYTLF